jgi:hypothetical protein
VPKPNPNKIDRQKKADSPPPAAQGAREAPLDTTDWIEVGHEEAEAQRQTGEAVPVPHGGSPGGGRAKPRRAER